MVYFGKDVRGSWVKQILLKMDKCQVCFENSEFRGVSSCNHEDKICYLCHYKMRVIKKDPKCPLCMIANDVVIITKEAKARFESVSKFKAFKEGIWSSDEETEKALVELERLVCKVCKQELGNLGQLKAHLKMKHKVFYCPCCLKSKTCSLNEQLVYSGEELKAHMEGEYGESGELVSFHPYCCFCEQSFYDESEFRTHLSERHEKCHLCKQPYIFYQDLSRLVMHFRQSHHYCEEQECQEKKMIVFGTAEELAFHTKSVHEKKAFKGKYHMNELQGLFEQPGKQFKARDKEGRDLSREFLTHLKDSAISQQKQSQQRVEEHVDLFQLYPREMRAECFGDLAGVEHVEDLPLFASANQFYEMRDVLYYRIQDLLGAHTYATFSYQLSKSDLREVIPLFLSFLKLPSAIVLLNAWILIEVTEPLRKKKLLADLQAVVLKHYKFKNDSIVRQCSRYDDLFRVTMKLLESEIARRRLREHLLAKQRYHQMKVSIKQLSCLQLLSLNFGINFGITKNDVLLNLIKADHSQHPPLLAAISHDQLVVIYYYLKIYLNEDHPKEVKPDLLDLLADPKFAANKAFTQSQDPIPQQQQKQPEQHNHKFEEMYPPIEPSPSKDKITSTSSYLPDNWQEDPKLKEQQMLQQQTIGVAKKKNKKQKVYLSGGFV